MTGISLSRFFAAEVQEPLGLDFWIGLPEAQEGRVAPLIDATAAPAARLLFTVARRQRRAKAAEMWSATGICTARSLARMYAAARGEVEGPRLISAPVLRAATRLQAVGGTAAC